MKQTTLLTTPAPAAPALPLVNLDDWKEAHGKAGSERVLNVLNHFAHVQPDHSLRRVLGIHSGDKVVAVAADISAVRSDELIVLTVQGLYDYQVGFLRRDSDTYWYVTIGDYIGPYFQPAAVEYSARIIAGERDGQRFILKCHKTDAPQGPARLLAFPSQSWHSVGAVAAGILADAAARGKGAQP